MPTPSYAHFTNTTNLGAFIYAALNGRICGFECSGDSNTRFAGSLGAVQFVNCGGGFAAGLEYANMPVANGGRGILGTFGTGIVWAGAAHDNNFWHGRGVYCMNAGSRPCSDKALAIDIPASSYPVGTATINLKNGGASEKLEAGDILFIGTAIYYVTAENIASAGGAYTAVGIDPPLGEVIADGAVVTVYYSLSPTTKLTVTGPKINFAAGYVGGETIIALDNAGSSMSGELAPGDTITISGQSYTITNYNKAAGNVMNAVRITPGLVGAVADNTAVTVTRNIPPQILWGHGITQAPAAQKALWDGSQATGMGNSQSLTCMASLAGTSQVGLQINPGSFKTSIGAVNANGTVTAGSSSIAIDQNGTGTLTGCIVAGDQFTVGSGYTGQIYTFTGTTKAAANAFAATNFLPQLQTQINDNAVVNLMGRAVRGNPVPEGDDWKFYAWTGTTAGSFTTTPKYRAAYSGAALTNFNEGAVAFDFVKVSNDWKRFTGTILAANTSDIMEAGFNCFMVTGTITPSPANPITFFGYQLVNVSANGINVSQFSEKAGQNFYEQYLALQAITAKQRGFASEMMTYEQVRRGLTQKMVRWIQGGINDFSAGAILSLDGVNNSDTAAGMKYNFREVRRRHIALDALAYSGGFTTLKPGDIYYIVFGPHVVADTAAHSLWSREQANVNYRTAMRDVCNEAEFAGKVSYWDITCVSYAELASSSGYVLPTNNAEIHLDPSGWDMIMSVASMDLKILMDMQAAGGSGGSDSRLLRSARV